MLISIDNIEKLTINNLIGVIPNRYVSNDKYFITLRPVKIQLSESTITIPKGYRFDGSSVPKFLRGLFPRYGAFMFAALIHDWLYYTDHKRDVLGIKKARKYADKEMLIWSNKINNRTFGNYIDNYIRYWAVRIAGEKVYKR